MPGEINSGGRGEERDWLGYSGHLKVFVNNSI